MRILFASLLATGLVGCAAEAPKPVVAPAPVAALPKPILSPPVNAPACGRPAEKVAFAMAALRMQLSVTELSCDGREKFNAFTNKFKGEVSTQNKTLGTFFSRAYGKRGVSQQDEYETSQINQMSQIGTSLGTGFCAASMPTFDQILALKNGQELANYAVAQNYAQVLTVPDCVEPPPKAATPAKPVAKAPVKKP